jgi:hypothetical protein
MALTPPRLTLPDIESTKAAFPPEVRSESGKTKWYLATAIIRHFLGDPWVRTHMVWDPANPSASPAGFFRMDFSSDEARERKSVRILDFAEMLFNLQNVKGFDDRVEHMKTSDPEATFAEFDFGRLLYVHNIDFAFVVPRSRAGEDYDCLLTYADGRTACADAKCRLESSEMRPEAVHHALEAARKQNLPKNAPGVIFVKVPESWLKTDEVRLGVADVAKRFLRQTERIVSVILYVNLTIYDERLLRQRYLLEETPNPKHRFDRSKSWIVFQPFNVPANWTGMPPKWQRILTLGQS